MYRTVCALLLAAVATTTLSGCTSEADRGDSGDSAAQAAHTAACRTYLLDAGAQDRRALRLLSVAERSGEWENAPINRVLNTTHDAASHAGATPGLSDDDFETFKALTTAYATAYAAANPADGQTGITAKTLNAFGDAIDAVAQTCDTP